MADGELLGPNDGAKDSEGDIEGSKDRVGFRLGMLEGSELGWLEGTPEVDGTDEGASEMSAYASVTFSQISMQLLLLSSCRRRRRLRTSSLSSLVQFEIAALRSSLTATGSSM